MFTGQVGISKTENSYLTVSETPLKRHLKILLLQFPNTRKQPSKTLKFILCWLLLDHSACLRITNVSLLPNVKLGLNEKGVHRVRHQVSWFKLGAPVFAGGWGVREGNERACQCPMCEGWFEGCLAMNNFVCLQQKEGVQRVFMENHVLISQVEGLGLNILLLLSRSFCPLCSPN